MTKKILVSTILALVAILGVFSFCGCAEDKPVADLLLVNGMIYTVDDQFTVADAVAVADGKILAVGTRKAVEASIASALETVDLNGQTVVPGLVDAHAHLFGYAYSLDKLDLVGTESPEAIAAMVKAKAEAMAPGEWITGRGWDQNDWPVKEFPDYTILDKVAPENPVLLTRIDGHAIWVNSRAMEVAGINKATQAPSGGEIIRDRRGNPTGIFVDNAEALVNIFIPPMSSERKMELLHAAVQNCLKAGLTGVHDMGGGPEGVAMIKELIDAGVFPFRVYYNYDAGEETLDELLAQGIQSYGDNRLIVRSVKAYADGALGSRGAALLEPYSDRPDSSGLEVTDTATLQAITEKSLKAGFQVSVHAIGDRGNRNTLDAYQAAMDSTGIHDARLRVEHAQIISPQDIPRFKELGVLPSMQPTHCTSDLPWAIDRVGDERIKGAYAWRSLLDTGVIIPCGSDFPVEDIAPLKGFYAAVTRKHMDGTPENGYFPEQKLTRQEALKGFTIWAAYAAFLENETGSIEPGKYADLVVLDRNIMEVPESEILGTRIMMTIVDGKVVFKPGE